MTRLRTITLSLWIARFWSMAGFAEVKQNHLDVAQNDYEKAIKVGAGMVSEAELKSWQDALDWVKTRWTGFADWQPANRGLLKVKAKEDTTQNPEACAAPPSTRYRGNENQLYRIEIQRGGTVETATYKWSRDSGSVIFPVRALNGTTAYLDYLGRDERLSLKEGDCVEIVDDSIAAQYQANSPRRLVQVEKLNLLDVTVILKTVNGAALPFYTENGPEHPLLRRWDYQQRESTDSEVSSTDNDGVLPVQEDTWLTLENGIQIYFTNSSANEPNVYRTGDYWLVAARTATGHVEWPKEIDDRGNVITDNFGNPVLKLLRPQGVTHHYAPLAIVSGRNITDVRNVFCPIQPCEPSNTAAARRTR